MTTKAKSKAKKEKIKILGKSYKVDTPVKETLINLADAIRSHELALMTWMHKDFIAKGMKKKEKNMFRESLSKYCLSIPDAEKILERMEILDKEAEDKNKAENKAEKEAEAKE